jgi:mono/diheme cytochrome c family protein
MGRIVWAALLGLMACGGGRADDGTATGDDTGQGESVSERVDRLLALDGSVSSGAEVYGAACASCHGGDGYGGVGPSIIGSYLELDDVLELAITGEGDMPASGLDDDELVDLMAYLEAEVLYEDLCRGARRCDSTTTTTTP